MVKDFKIQREEYKKDLRIYRHREGRIVRRIKESRIQSRKDYIKFLRIQNIEKEGLAEGLNNLEYREERIKESRIQRRKDFKKDYRIQEIEKAGL